MNPDLNEEIYHKMVSDAFLIGTLMVIIFCHKIVLESSCLLSSGDSWHVNFSHNFFKKLKTTIL